MKILFVCFLFGLGTAGVLGRRCVVYTAGETIPAIPKGFGRTCHSVTNDKNRYCIEWDCPPTDCSNPTNPNKDCPYCKGTCVVDGSVYQEGVSFKCPDGCNRCTCSSSTLMGCNMKTPPQECMGIIN